ncbi:MAG: MerR family transcriptional regulator [Gemmatimonadaceae bacterium]|nr:MerR family transcriptional regulator [Gemmatimonadaceae bacterium]
MNDAESVHRDAGRDAQSYSLDDLAERAEIPARTVRYYIQLGLVDRPLGAGKGAYYTPRHLEQLLHIRKWQLAGLSLERIGDLLRQGQLGGDRRTAALDDRPLPPTPRRPGTVELWSHLVVADGVEVVLEAGKAGLSPEQVRVFFRAVASAYAAVQRTNDANATSTAAATAAMPGTNHSMED